MKDWIKLLCLAAIIASFPYWRWLIKRIILGFKLNSFCKKKGFALHRVHPLWMFGLRRGRNCDFYIETHSQIISVKLFGIFRHRRHVLVFNENGTFFLRKIDGILTSTYSVDTKPRRLQEFNFRNHYRTKWELKAHKSVLLVHPVPQEIRRRNASGAEVVLGAGDTVHGMTIYTLSRFLGYLEGEVQ